MDEILNLNLFYDPNYTIHDLERHRFSNLYCFIPENYTADFKSDIKAVLTKHAMGYKSVDYVVKRQSQLGSKKQIRNPYAILLNEIIDEIWKNFTKIKEELTELVLNNESGITLGLKATFLRLENSYDSILFLIKNQFYFESNSINRLIFEQLNYNFKLAQLTPSDLKNKSSNQLSRILNPTNINKFKDFFNNDAIGRFYSFLSELTHIGYGKINEYLTYSEEEKDYSITRKDITQSILTALNLLYNVDLHRIVFEYCFADNSNISIESLIKKGDKYVASPNRQIGKKYLDYFSQFKELLKQVEIETYISKKDEIIDEDLPF